MLFLPQPEWVNEVQPDIEPSVYWLLVAHETAHYLASVLGNTTPSHNNGMYAVLLAITLSWQLPIDKMYVEERDYIPLALERGMKATGNLLIEALVSGATLISGR